MFFILQAAMILSALLQSNSSMTTQYRKRRISSLNEAIEENFHFGWSNNSYLILEHRNDKVNISSIIILSK